jgi:hypothetical protein
VLRELKLDPRQKAAAVHEMLRRGPSPDELTDALQQRLHQCS